MAFDELREDYAGTPFLESGIDPDPIRQFSKWFDDALDAKVPMANAMTLSTVDANGQPNARIVLLKDVSQEGFCFFTNYESRKGQALLNDPRAALNFYWEPLFRQVCIEGTVERIDAKESDAYFQSRPRESNIAAMASAQSQTVASREALEAAFAAMRSAQTDKELVRPAKWGGYRLRPERIEFWQGRESRLHDRLEYSRKGSEAWSVRRLFP